jgi:hypothetical protein
MRLGMLRVLLLAAFAAGAYAQSELLKYVGKMPGCGVSSATLVSMPPTNMDTDHVLHHSLLASWKKYRYPFAARWPT